LLSVALSFIRVSQEVKHFSRTSERIGDLSGAGADWLGEPRTDTRSARHPAPPNGRAAHRVCRQPRALQAIESRTHGLWLAELSCPTHALTCGAVAP
jgi:hypothetical protein